MRSRRSGSQHAQKERRTTADSGQCRQSSKLLPQVIGLVFGIHDGVDGDLAGPFFYSRTSVRPFRGPSSPPIPPNGAALGV